MSQEHLEWLTLSAPTTPSQKPPPVAGHAPCYRCGWPVAPEVETCPHCHHSRGGVLPANLLDDLNLKLPPPVIDLTPPPESWFRGPATDSPALYQLRLQAEQLRLTTGFDRLICLDDISVDHYRHQLDAALRALRDMRGRALLADEVGLGKTIEAGIVMKELIERGLVKSVLILTPASLTWQWREEMDAKFHESFEVLERLKQLPDPVDDQPCRWIVSLPRAKNNRWAQPLLSRSYDLLIVDEAHKLKNHQTRAYKFVNQIRKQYVLMLTATPVHNDLMELYNLITILRPGLLGTRQAFRDDFVQNVAPRPAYRTVYSTPHPDPYLRRSQAARQEARQNGQADWFADRVDDITRLRQLRLNRQGRRAVAEIERLQLTGYQIFDFEAIKSFFWSSYSFVCRLKLMHDDDDPAPVSSHRITPLNPGALRRLLSEVMIRNRRSHVDVQLPARRAAIYAFNLTPPERELYDKTTAYIRQKLRQQRANPDGRSTGPLRMALMSLQKQLCSSPQAAARTLRKLVDRQPDEPQLAEALVLAWGIQQGRKITAVLEILQEYPGKFLIFTDYLPTLEALHRDLTQAGIETVVFHGGLSAQERVEVVRQFRQSARVMISTQSGSEGHNLQFCHQLINFDLPWNPMRIEQRVGRLHRLGQPETVSIFNLSANHTIEAYVLDLLARKIRMFELVIGELDMVLGQLDDNRGFERQIETAWADSYSDEELGALFAEVEKTLTYAQKIYGSVRNASDELSDLLAAFDEVHQP